MAAIIGALLEGRVGPAWQARVVIWDRRQGRPDERPFVLGLGGMTWGNGCGTLMAGETQRLRPRQSYWGTYA